METRQANMSADPALGVLVAVFAGDGFDAEPYACLGVDLHVSGGAPSGERVRIDVDFLGGLAATPESFQDALRAAQPLVVAFWEAVSIDKQLS